MQGKSHAKKYAVMALPIAGSLTAFGAAISFLKKH